MVLFPRGDEEGRRGAAPHSNIFSSCQKKKKQNADGEPSAPQPLPGPPPWGPEPFTRYFTRSLRQYLSWGLRRAMPLVFFIIIISHFKMRNKRIFNEPSQQACVCFILVSGDGGSREGLLVSLHVSALPPSSGEGRKRGPGGGPSPVLPGVAVPSVPGQSQPVGNSSWGALGQRSHCR